MLWDAVLEMFRESFHEPVEDASGGNTEWAKHRLLLKPDGRSTLAAIQLGPVAPHPELVSAIFFPSAVELCLAEFTQLRQELPFHTWPADSPKKDAGIIEIQFPIKSLVEWEERKEKLAAITQSVYAAFIANED